MKKTALMSRKNLSKTVKINKTLSRIKNNYGEKKKTKVIIDSAKTENADRIISLPKKIEIKNTVIIGNPFNF